MSPDETRVQWIKICLAVFALGFMVGAYAHIAKLLTLIANKP